MKKRTKRKLKRLFIRLFILVVIGVGLYFGYKLLFDKKEVSKDNVGPVISHRDVFAVTQGSSVNLMDGVSATDEVDGKVEVKVEGLYDTNKVGTYELYYVAKDKSGNVTKESFKLIVSEKVEVKDNTNRVEFTTSKGFKGYTENGITYIDGLLVVNKTYSLPESYNPVKLNGDTEAAANKMFAAAKQEKGFNMWAQSGFRSYETQKKLYNNYVARDGKSEADKYSARPGHSEHQSGLAFDVCATNKPCISNDFDDTAEAKWLSDNCYKYGFILRFVKGKESETGYQHESWHFRYVGKELAEKLYNNGDWITLEDYLGITSTYNE